MQSGPSSSTSNDDLAATKSQEYHPNDVNLDSAFLPQASRSLSSYLDCRFLAGQQDLINRHALCLTRLRQTAREVESLLQENAALRTANRELNNNLSMLIQASVQKYGLSDDYNIPSPNGIVNGFRDTCNVGGSGGDDFGEDECPTSVIELQNVDSVRNTLPKSISVRSNGYLKMNHAAATAASKTRGVTRPRITSPLNAAIQQKVHVRRGKKEEEPLELEVYNQGMFKTELCNKWQETGACAYGDHCQFAHGIEELRPVIRHPRYKTEVCRMALAGDVCPYGHRCHFRHALTEQERFTGNLQPKAIKLDR